MMRNVIVSPVGTSLLGNAIYARVLEQYEKLFKEHGIEVSELPRLKAFDKRNIPQEDGVVCKLLSDSGLRSSVMAYIEKVGSRASAEIRGINEIANIFSLTPSETLVLLYSTATCNSRFCADMVASFLRGRGYSVEIEDIPIRYAEEEEGFYETIAELLDRVVSRVIDYKRRGMKIYVNATPGYKAEVSFLTLASLLAGADSIIYIHEAFDRAVILPQPPIKMGIDREKLRKILGIFRDTNEMELRYVAGVELSDEEIRWLRDSAIVKMEPGKIRLRPWVRTLIKTFKLE